jgi:hypothetical protein
VTPATSDTFGVRGILTNWVRFGLAVIEPVEIRVVSAQQPRANLDWCIGLTLWASCTVAMTVLAASNFRPELMFWGGLFLLALPLMTRAAWPGVSSSEHIYLLILLAAATFAVKLLYSPTGFGQFDEFLHVVTATDILKTKRLFSSNSMLPISPRYPAMEIVTTALCSLSGMTIFHAATIVLLACRTLFIVCLYRFLALITRSSRIAVISCLLYMGSSVYVLFDSQFAYESLAVPLFAFLLFIETKFSDRLGFTAYVFLVLLVVFPLTTSHHLTSYAAESLLLGFVFLTLIRRATLSWRIAVAPVLLGLSILFWSAFIGDPAASYLGPLIAHVSAGVQNTIHHQSSGRQFFQAEDGTSTPQLLQLVAVMSVLIIAGLLSVGFFTSLAAAAALPAKAGWGRLRTIGLLRWHNDRLLGLTLLTLLWPLTVVLRVVPSGWEIGNRMSYFVFIAVGLVGAIAIMRCWRSNQQWLVGSLMGMLLATVFLGGVVSGWGVPGAKQYRVEADGLSIEPMGIATSRWARTHLGEGNRFVSDRDNTILLATYGRQDIVSSIYDGLDTSYLFSSIKPDGERSVIAQNRIHYLLADLRLTTGLPFIGSYFETTEPDELHARPLDSRVFFKYDHTPGVSRVFDNGYIMIYDVSRVQPYDR